MSFFQDVDDWKHVRCLCGALVGRCQLSPVTKTTAFRLPKYSIRPVATNARPIRIPMSAYVVEDMTELSQAHATYRFVVCDEEEEKPRLLVCHLFFKQWFLNVCCSSGSSNPI